LNISNILQVTINPPKILIEASKIAIKPIADILKLSESPNVMIAPTIITPETAFVTAISGVCKAGVTRHTTKYPTKQAKTNEIKAVVKGDI